MLKKQLLAISAVLILFSSCKKDLPHVTVETEPTGVSVENGYLVFENYSLFFKTLVRLGFSDEERRLEWEKSMGFTSLYTCAMNFETEMDAVDSIQSIQQYQAVKTKYADVIKWSDEQNYYLNATGALEAKLINRRGVVKVGNDFLYMDASGKKTFKNLSYDQVSLKISALRHLTNSKSNTKMSSIQGEIVASGPPPANAYNVNTLKWDINNYVDGKKSFYSRLKLYNLNSSQSGNRGFLSVEYFAKHKNWLGTWRLVSSHVSSITDNITITFSDDSKQVASYGDYPGTSTGWADVDGYVEKIVLISSYLKTSGITGTPLSDEYSAATKTVDDDVVSSNGYYWMDAFTGTFQGVPLNFNFADIYATSFGDGIAPGIGTYTVTLDQYQDY